MLGVGMKKLFLVLCVTVGCFWYVPVFAKPTLSTPPSSNQQSVAGSLQQQADTSQEAASASGLENKSAKAQVGFDSSLPSYFDAPLESPGTVKESQLGQPGWVFKPLGPSVHPVAPPSPSVTQSSSTPTNGFWDNIAAKTAATYAATVSGVKTFFQPQPSNINQPSVTPSTSPVINNQPAVSSPPPITQNNSTPTNGFWGNIAATTAATYAATVSGVKTFFQPQPSNINQPSVAPVESPGTVKENPLSEPMKDAVASYPPSGPNLEPVEPPPPEQPTPSISEQPTEEPPAPSVSEQPAEAPPAPSVSEQPAEAPPMPSVSEQPAETPPTPSVSEQQAGVQGLPGIYLNDNTGNGNDKPYGIPGLPGIYVNGPREGSGIGQPAEAPPPEPSISEQPTEEPPPPPSVSEQPTEAPPTPSVSEQPAEAGPAPAPLDLTHAQAVVDSIRESN